MRKVVKERWFRECYGVDLQVYCGVMPERQRWQMTFLGKAVTTLMQGWQFWTLTNQPPIFHHAENLNVPEVRKIH